MDTICQTCGAHGTGPSGRCRHCGGVALVAEAWSRHDPTNPATPVLTSRAPGLEGVHLKVEGANLSGSFKDRVMRVLVQDAASTGIHGAVVASSGNAAVAASSACARAGLPLLVLVPNSVSPTAVRMVAQRGATVVRAGEGPAAVHGLAARLAQEYGLANLASTFGAAGCEWACRAIGHEIAEQVAGPVARVFASISVGPVLIGAGNGLVEAARPLPALVGAQAVECGPIAAAYAEGAESVSPWTGTATTAALAIADRLTGYADEATFALKEIRKSGGSVGAVTDDEMLAVRRDLARYDGLDVELASCAAPALLRAEGGDREGVVCILTGAGYKETLAASAVSVPNGTVEEFVARAEVDARLLEEVESWVRSSQS